MSDVAESSNPRSASRSEQAAAHDWRMELANTLIWMGRPVAPVGELNRCEMVAEGFDKFYAMPTAGRRDLLELLVARLRGAQATRPELDSEILSVLRLILECARSGEGVFVRGARIDSQPRMGTWVGDAEQSYARLLQRTFMADDLRSLNPDRVVNLLDALVGSGKKFAEIRPFLLAAMAAGMPAGFPRLVRTMRPFLEHLADDPAYKPLRVAIRALDTGGAENAPVAATGKLPACWPGYAVTRGVRAAMVGGEPREEIRQRIQAQFGFARLDWARAEKSELDGIISGIRNGKIRFVFILKKFCHAAAVRSIQDACRESGSTIGFLNRGYSLDEFQQVIERHSPSSST